MRRSRIGRRESDMDKEAEIRIPRIISDSELQRRWSAVRHAMKERGLDFLILQNCTDYLGGYVKWFTDMPALHNYPVTVLFPREEEMTTIWSGPLPPSEPNPPAWSLRGVKKRISVPIIPALGYTSAFDAEKAVEELSPYKKCRIGFVGMGFISASFYKHITEHLREARFEDATDLVDTIKVIKSEEEILYIKETCEMQDAAFEYALTRIQPGRRDYQVYADVRGKCMDMGSEQQLVMVGSAPANRAGVMYYEHFGNRIIQEGDVFTILIESNGPSGFYGHIARIVCLGHVPHALEEQFELARQAQKITLDLLKPGADPSHIWDANNAFMRSIGYPEETRIYAHGQGYDLVERPSLDPYETMKIQANMNISVHPSVVSQKAFAFVCENYIVKESGEKICLHKTPQKVFTI
jgi:Xaa-Pro aminopeptidase